jgi:protein TonB
MHALAPALLALALQAAARPPATPPASPPASPPAPRPPTGWPFSLLSDDDYPAAALRAEEEGRVGYRLVIGPDGRVSACTIVQSSGSAALDAATCRIMRARARFAPARDAAGNAVADSRVGRITWALPGEPPPPPPPPPPLDPATPYPGPPLPYAPAPDPEPDRNPE